MIDQPKASNDVIDTNDSKSETTALEHLFSNNRKWAAAMSSRDPQFFAKLAAQQTPDYLWIGCSDSRVPANEIVNLLPGEMFVHRNIANVVCHSDLNCLTVLQFAIDVLRVKHIIVSGHYGCSGVHAALTKKRVGLADNWLRHVQDVHQKHGKYFGDTLPKGDELDRLCELNVIEQAINVCETTLVQDAWERGQPLTIHSWIYGIKDGLLRDLGLTINGADELAEKLPETLARYDL